MSAEIVSSGVVCMRIWTASFCVIMAFGLVSCSFDASGLDKIPKGCGNGVQEEGEACDDHNRDPGDGCDAACSVEEGWTCSAAGCTPVCGDGRILGMEQCDDGGLLPDDGCDAECRVEPGWYCEDVPSACETRCGDGVRAGGEACDDGNLSAQDGCSELCRVEPGFACDGTAPSTCTPVCGDNLVVAGEVCDGVNLDGKTCQSFGFYQGMLGCMSDCRHFDQANCTRTCGDGIIDADFGEACDTDAFEADDTCVSQGYPGGTLGCSGTCELDTTPCNRWTEVSVGESHACALRSDATVWCWGYNFYGQLGQPSSSFMRSAVPVQIPSGGATVVTIESGYNHICAVISDKTVWCWGANSYGQLGNGQTQGSPTPVQVKLDADRTLENVVKVSAGESHTCALTGTGAVYCWGSNVFGQLGDGTTTGRLYATPLPTLASGVVDLAAGQSHTCAVKSDGTAWCWGSNTYGELGTEPPAPRHLPTSVDWGTTPAPTLASLSCGEDFTCVVSNTGNMFCFGYNIFGQLGNGQATSTFRPSPVTLPDPARRAAAGGSHACAVLQSGNLFCWGYNIDGQVGDGSQTQRNTPVQVSILDAVGLAGAGKRHTCAVQNGQLFCWGLNSDGQVGDGSYASRHQPTAVSVSGM